jgi:hypothetical protein
LQKENKKKIPYRKILFTIQQILAFGILIASIVEISRTDNDELRSRMIFNALMAIAFVISSFIPMIVEKAWKINIPTVVEVVYIIFATLSLILGEIGDFYIKYRWWDSMLHAMSGIILGCIGFMIINLCNGNEHVKSFKLGAGFAAIFVFSFTIMCGTIWEVVEWFADAINGTNMQRYQDNITGTGFVGRDAIYDTMKDLILDAAGGFLVSILGYLDIKFNKGLVNKLKFNIVENQNTQD